MTITHKPVISKPPNRPPILTLPMRGVTLRISPPDAAAFSVMMLGSTPSGDAYTFSELERMFANAGFAGSEMHELPPTIQRVVISRK